MRDPSRIAFQKEILRDAKEALQNPDLTVEDFLWWGTVQADSDFNTERVVASERLALWICVKKECDKRP